MKYNKAKIMKRAWELKKITNDIFSLCLKAAWAEAKNTEEVLEISLDGFTGTDKQKKYAEDLIADVISTVQSNPAGYHAIKGGVICYTDQKVADSIKAAYISIKFAVSTKKTYGDVIDLLKNTSILTLADSLRSMARRNNETVFYIANRTIDNAKKSNG